ncbi:hypothetical protein [Hymenobacter sp. YC55]|uniref:hypothetical protein n=1 Tax=Hymenobacter sp. YC55 TaxID=3034019 RepID=UPI0023F7410A|nr:hypothetical protein [Hymenobacter sp. YC55]MDF7810876.1 hypothetical protein [Hymenobacter sp. YC55]
MCTTRLLERSGWLLSLLVLPMFVRAQGQDVSPNRTLLVKLIPQYVVVSGYWLEVEKSWNQHPRQSFTLTPQVYAGRLGQPNAPTAPAITDPKETVRGAGVQLQHRLYLSATQANYPAGLYVSYGPNYQHFAVSGREIGWIEVHGPTGLPQYEYSNGPLSEKINRYGATAQVGYQAPLHPGRFFLDVYAGAGWRTSTSRRESEKVESRYRTGTSDYGHEGFYFPAGFKVGVALR